ncbi:PapB family radical SAM/SPASM ranthipeptide maturase [Abyssisolibacter fermentans]|uniref:PapB family radical SAM/SPASM ranthipeptide maturase n=1 Tax=Abyssisolibacter fermentans TaxID=1766203 RepID=UPI00138F517E|nr:radical SAM protein [Abyssisolibacter fermentans]
MINSSEAMHLSDYKIFCVQDSKYVYYIENNKIFKIDNKTEKLLGQDGKSYKEIYDNLQSIYTQEELDTTIKAMKEHDFIIDNIDIINNEQGDVAHNFPDMMMVTLLIVQECNLRCSYCFGENGEYNDRGVMDIETAKKAIDFFVKNSKNDTLTICFFGGEPLMRFDLIKEIVAYCEQKKIATSKNFKFTMTTNATLLNEEIEQFIIKHDMNVLISIDGDKETHDYNRYFKGKVGCHDIVLAKTQSLRNKNLLTARATVTGKQLDINSIYNYLDSLNFKKIILSPAFNLLSDEEYDKAADGYIAMYKELEELIKKKAYEEIYKNKIFITGLKKIHNSNRRSIACGVGRNTCTVDIHGNIYPCQRFVNNKEFVMGNIDKGFNNRSDFLNNITLEHRQKCSKCWARNLCIGGCIHTNYTSTGDINLPSDQFCNFTRKIWKELIKIYLRMSKEDINILLEGKEK